MSVKPGLLTRRLVVQGYVVDVRGTFAPARPADGRPPLVLVHGIGVSGRYLLRLAEEFAADHDVYVPDLPGYGSTPKPPRPLAVPELGRVVAGVVEELGLAAPVLVGHSMGCQVVVHAVGRHPGLCAAYVLVSPTVDRAARDGAVQAWRLLRDAIREPPRTVLLVLDDYARMGPLRYLRTARSMVSDRIGQDIRSCCEPGLVVRGSRDPIVPHRWAQNLARMAPDARLVEVPGAAHAVPYTHALELAAACAPFFASVAR